MERREFFPLLPLWLRALPSAAIGMVFFVPIVVLKLHGHFVGPDSPLVGFDSTVAQIAAVIGLALEGLLLLAVVTATKKRTAVLAIDNSTLTTPVISLPWSSVRHVAVRKCFGLSALCVSTADDDALIKEAPINLKLWYGMRRWLLGAPVAVPPVREMPLTDLCTLIEQFRAANVALRP